MAAVVCGIAAVVATNFLVLASKQRIQQQTRQVAVIEASNTLDGWLARPWEQLSQGERVVDTPPALSDLAQEAEMSVTIASEPADDDATRAFVTRRITVHVQWLTPERTTASIQIHGFRHGRESDS
jgi:acyl carrier protein phosphodiesterase